MTRELLSEAESLLPGGLRPPQREGPGQLQRKWTEALRSTVGDRPACSHAFLLRQSRGGLAPRLRPGPGSGPAAAAHLLFGACHLEAGAEVIQPLPLLVPPQALQVLPQHLDDLKPEGGLRVCWEAQSGLMLLPRGTVAQVPAGLRVEPPGSPGAEGGRVSGSGSTCPGSAWGRSSAEGGAHLLHLQPHGLQALGVAFLQDAELRLGQVQGRAARSVQGIYPGPCASRQR